MLYSIHLRYFQILTLELIHTPRQTFELDIQSKRVSHSLRVCERQPIEISGEQKSKTVKPNSQFECIFEHLKWNYLE